MKLAFQYIYLVLAILLGLLTVTSAQLINGDFTSGLTGWTATGSVYPETYQSQALASFNGNAALDSPNDGVLAQTIPTVPGARYSVAFNLGATGSALGSQRLQVGAEVFQIDKTHATQWEAKQYTFTATTAATPLVFKDVSAATNGIDLLLDDVVVTASVVAVAPPAVLPVTTTAPCQLAWDAQPGCEYRLYLGSELLQTVATNAATVTLPDDRLSSVSVSATLSGAESPRSAVLVVQPVTSWETTNLVGWGKVAVGFVEFNPLQRFFRISYPLTHTPTP